MLSFKGDNPDLTVIREDRVARAEVVQQTGVIEGGRTIEVDRPRLRQQPQGLQPPGAGGGARPREVGHPNIADIGVPKAWTVPQKADSCVGVMCFMLRQFSTFRN